MVEFGLRRRQTTLIDLMLIVFGLGIGITLIPNILGLPVGFLIGLGLRHLVLEVMDYFMEQRHARDAS